MEWRKLLDTLLQKTWNPSKAQKLRELWKSCSDFHGFPQLNDVSKLRKLAKLIEQFCDSKASVPADLAGTIKEIEKEGLQDSATYDYGKPVYLGFVPGGPAPLGGGYFAFKCRVTQKSFVGMDIDENGFSKQVNRKTEKWGFAKLWLSGEFQEPKPLFTSEAAIDNAWAEMKANKDMKITTGDPKKIKVA